MTIVGPGLLVAATGVGAGDLATAGFAGSKLGVIVLWAIVLGAAMKFVLNEGLARWQLATDTTLLDGVRSRIGPWAIIVFLVYLIPFSFVVGGALISATGVATYSIIGWPGDPDVAKLLWGGIGSLLATILVLSGGFKVFERVMAAGIAIMFLAVLWTAMRLGVDAEAMLRGLVPSHPGGGEPLDWTIGLIGGVGGTVTVLCYGYWIKQAGRSGMGEVRACRLDLAVAYIATALFGVAMLVIASGIQIDGTGTGLLIKLSARLHETLGPTGAMIFLVGAWAAIASSLLGVWQSVPMLFADACQTLRRCERRPADQLPRTWTYRIFLLLMASLPMFQAGLGFATVQRAYAIFGAFFLPLLAIVLLFLNRRRFIGQAFNRPWTSLALLGVLAFFGWAGVAKILG